jgi:hypothetical protein
LERKSKRRIGLAEKDTAPFDDFFLARKGVHYCLKNTRKSGGIIFVLGLDRKIFRARFWALFSLVFRMCLSVVKKIGEEK